MGKSQLDQKIFGKKKLSNLFEEIYENQKKREQQVAVLIEELKPMINDIGDATLVVPLLKEYLEIGVKNDEALIKMAALVQKTLKDDNAGNAEDAFGLTDAEKEDLLNQVKNYNAPKKDD